MGVSGYGTGQLPAPSHCTDCFLVFGVPASMTSKLPVRCGQDKTKLIFWVHKFE
jgi:hypothetical protein